MKSEVNHWKATIIFVALFVTITIVALGPIIQPENAKVLVSLGAALFGGLVVHLLTEARETRSIEFKRYANAKQILFLIKAYYKELEQFQDTCWEGFDPYDIEGTYRKIKVGVEAFTSLPEIPGESLEFMFSRDAEYLVEIYHKIYSERVQLVSHIEKYHASNSGIDKQLGNYIFREYGCLTHVVEAVNSVNGTKLYARKIYEGTNGLIVLCKAFEKDLISFIEKEWPESSFLSVYSSL
jgi:hypothetical protein